MKKLRPTTRNYEVGHGKPPKATQFRKGQTGNPKGRTRGSENLIAVFKRYANKRVKVNDNGTVTTVSLAEAVIAQNVKAALNKDPNAMGNILRLADHAGEFQDSTDPKVMGKPLMLPSPVDTEELLAFHGAGIIVRPKTRTGVQSDL